MAGNWIKQAIGSPGALTRKAKNAKMGVQEFAQAKQNAPGRTGKQARLALTLKKINSKMPKGGSLTPKGDLGELRQKESDAVGGFKKGAGAAVRASSALPVRPHKAAKGD